MYEKHSDQGASSAAVAGRRPARRGLARVGAAAVAASAVAGAVLAGGPAFAATASHHAAVAASYSFTTLDDQADPTFNQLLGINKHNVISGYFGSGAPGHPNKGYLLHPPYGQANYVNENFPGSVQTQVTGLNDNRDTVGFWVNGSNTNRGFVEWNGAFTSYTNPKTPHVKGAVNQLLGINDAGIAVGFYNDAAGNAHAYKLNQATGQFTKLTGPWTSGTATGINNSGDIAGFAGPAGSSFSWLRHNGQLTTLQFPGGSDTQAFGINGKDQIAGTYLDGGGVMHGFVLTSPLGPVSHWQTIDDPNGVGSTTVNGINYAGDLVGFYTDAAGNTDGMLAQP